jgi:hypothetical protein
MSSSYAKHMRKTRKNGGMIRALQQISKQRQPSIASESRPKHKTSSLRNRIHDAIVAAENVYPVAKPVVAESSNIPVVHAVPVKESNVTSSLNEMIVDKKIYSDKPQAKPLTNPVTNPASKPQAKPLNNPLNPMLKPLQGESSEKASMTMDNLETIMNDMKPKPPSNKKISQSPRIKPLPPKGPLPKEYVEALGKIMPPKPPPRIGPKITKKEVSLVSLVKAILEDNIKILTEAEPDPSKTPEVDTTTISRFYMERIRASKMEGVCRVTMSDLDMEIPWETLDECTPILISAKFGLVNPCKQIMESVDDNKKIEMLKDFDKDGNTPLSLCAKYGYQKLCEYFIGEHQRLNVRMEGIEWDRMEWLSEKQSINELIDENLDLTLSYSVFLNKLRDIEKTRIKDYDYQLKKFESITLFGNYEGSTPLMIAVENGHLGIVELLLCGGRVSAVQKLETKQNITTRRKARSTNKTQSNSSTTNRELRTEEEIARMCANPLAMNSIKMTSLHLCVKRCCPSESSYKTVLGNVVTNDVFRLQYNQVHDDKYKNMNHKDRFNRIIHLLLRFMIFDRGIINGNYRPNGLKIALQNMLYSNSHYDDGVGIDIWDKTRNQFTTFLISNKTNWISLFQKKTGIQSSHSVLSESSSYISAFIRSNKLKNVVFNNSSEKCLFIRGDKNIFIELEKGFAPEVFRVGEHKYMSMDGLETLVNNTITGFVDYYSKSVLYTEKEDRPSLNEQIIDSMSRGRDVYMRRIEELETIPYLRRRIPFIRR